MKLLVFVEPTSRGEWAITLTQDLALGLRGTVMLLTTNEILAEDPQILDRTAEKFSGIAGLSLEKRVRPGPARDAIVEESRESRPAITIVPPAGRKGLARWIKGSRVKDVVHNAPSTVMVARKPVSEHIRSILVTISGGPMSETTALGACEIAQAIHAQLTVLHVTSSVTIPFGESSSTPTPRDITHIRDLLTRNGVEPRMRLREGMVVNEILHECEAGGYDLLILGQHLVDMDAGGPFSENIAEVIAIQCSIPVLVIRPRRWFEDASPGQQAEAPTCGKLSS